MAVFDLGEFKEWSDSNPVREYILDSDNNEWNTPCRFHTCLRFQTVSVGGRTGRIIFRSGSSSLTLPRVKEVRIHEHFNTVGTVFDVICLSDDGKEVSWRFLAD